MSTTVNLNGTDYTDGPSAGAVKGMATNALDGGLRDNLMPMIEDLLVEIDGAATDLQLVEDWAQKTDDYVEGTDNSAKSWSVGGTGNGQPSAGSAKNWAQLTGAYVTSSLASAKEWAVGTFIRGVAGMGSAKDWSVYTGGTVDGTGFSAKYNANLAAASETAAAASALAAGNLALWWTYGNSTTMGNPGTGGLRLNHGTAASVTAIAVSASLAISGNPDRSDYVATWSASTNTAHRGDILLKKANGATELVYAVTGAVVDNGTWLQIPVSHVSGGTMFTDADSLTVQFSRTGNKGIDGAGGDMFGANNLSDVANAAMAFGNIKQAASTTATGVVEKSTSGENVAGTATDKFPDVAGVKEMIDTHVIVAETGDLCSSMRTSKTGWVLASGRTIGDASSSATERANADTENLFTLLWNNLANAEAAVSGGRGANAAADFAAHKNIALPDLRGRTIVGKDNMGTDAARMTTGGSGLDGDTLGKAGGDQLQQGHTHTATTSSDGSHTHSGTTSSDGAHTHTGGAASPTDSASSGSGGNFVTAQATTASNGAHTHTMTTDSQGAHTHTLTTASTGSGSSQNVQPSYIANIFIKL